jgi:hypothetical protein
MSGHHFFVLLVDDIGQPLTAIMMAMVGSNKLPICIAMGGEWRRTVLELSEDLSSRQSLSLSVVKNKKAFPFCGKKKSLSLSGSEQGSNLLHYCIP